MPVQRVRRVYFLIGVTMIYCNCSNVTTTRSFVKALNLLGLTLSNLTPREDQIVLDLAVSYLSRKVEVTMDLNRDFALVLRSPKQIPMTEIWVIYLAATKVSRGGRFYQGEDGHPYFQKWHRMITEILNLECKQLAEATALSKPDLL